MLKSAAFRSALLTPLFMLHCPEMYLALFKTHWCVGIASAFALWLFLFVLTLLESKGQRTGFSILFGVYAFVLILGNIVPAYFSIYIGGWARFFIVVLVTSLFIFSGKRTAVHIIVTILVLALLYLLAVDIYFAVLLKMLLLVALALFIGIYVRAKSLTFGMAGFGTSLFAIILNFWAGVPVKKLEVVKAQRDVKVIVDYSFVATDALLSKLPYRSDLKFVVDSCGNGEYLVGVRREVSGLLCFNPNNYKNYRFFKISEEIGDNAAVDCSNGSLYFGTRRSGKIYVLDRMSFNVRNTIDLGHKLVGAVYLDSERLYVLYDQSVMWAAIERSNLKRVEWLSGQGFNNGLLIDQANGRIYYLTRNGTVSLLNEDDLKVINSTKVNGGVFGFLNMALASDRNELFIFSLESSDVQVLDAFSLKLIRTKRLVSGARFSIYNPKNKKIYVANYFKGELYELEPITLSILRKWYLGTRLRWLELTRDGDSILATSSLGAFKVEIADGQS